MAACLLRFIGSSLLATYHKYVSVARRLAPCTHTALDLPAAESLVLADFAPEAGADLLDDDDLEWVEDGTEDERTEP